MIRDAVLHILNEQPLLADLLSPPGPSDTILACTNLRALSGKRPVWIDDSASMFYFPMGLIRFVEIHPGSEGLAGLPPAREARETRPRRDASVTREAEEANARPDTAADQPHPAPEAEPDLEIDEDFLRRVRDV